MTLAEILDDIHACEEDMLVYERKYGVRSATFYESYMQGDEPPNGASVLDWAGWAGQEFMQSGLNANNSILRPFNCYADKPH